jgi:hypothetical protein
MSQFTHAEMADEIAKMVWSKQTWLDDFGSGRNKRPDHDIETKQRELAVLEQAHADYRRVAKRSA